MRASVPAFGGTLEVEVRDLPRAAADAAIRAAAAEVGEVERLTDPGRPDGELAALNAAAGKGPRRIDARLFAALTRALNFCVWSDGKEGPLARDLNRLWGAGGGAPPAGPPTPDQVSRAVAAADCKRLALDAGKQTATLAAGSALDLVDFSTGMAVDRAIEVLRQHGSANAFIQIRDVRRGIGAGRDGRGWLVDLPAITGLAGPLGRIFLRDQSLAIANREAFPPEAGRQPPIYVDQRSGQPAGDGVLATLAITELATDAQALAATMTITGAQEGELLTGSVRPRPSILWLMGSGTGIPVLVPYRWSEVPRR
jgi:thiamine biosynthesis lipoprotein